MKSLLCLVACVLAVVGVMFITTDAKACDQFSQQMQFSAIQAYSAPALVQTQVAAVEYAVAPQFLVTQRQFVSAPVYQQAQQVNFVAAPQYQQVEFIAACSRAGCSRAAIRGPGRSRSRSVQRSVFRG